MPSLQLQRYLEERAAGGSVADACFVSGIDAVEAELHEADIASGALELPRASAPVRPCTREPNLTEENEAMATQVRINEDGDTESSALLRNFVERIENLHTEKDALQDDLKEVYAEAKSHGFDTNVMRALIKRRKNGMDAAHEFDALLEAYENAVQHQLPLPMQSEIRKPNSERKLESVN